MLWLVPDGELSLPEGEALLRVRPMEPAEVAELLEGEAEVRSALPHMTVLVARHKMRLELPEGRETPIRLEPGDVAVVVRRQDDPEVPFRFLRVERLDAETPAGRLTAEKAGDEGFPGLLVSVGGEPLALVEHCGDHGAPAVHVYHTSRDEPVVDVHVYPDGPAVELVSAGEPRPEAGGVWRFGRDVD